MARPCSSQAARVSSSRFEPPGWIRAVTPAAAAASGPSRKGKKASEASTAPRARVAGLGDGDPDRVEPAHLPGADADELPAPGQHDRVRLDRLADPPGEPERRPLLGASAARRVATCPGGGVGLHRVPVLDEQAALDPAQVEARRGGGVRADRRLQVEQADAVLPGRLGGQEPERVGLEAGGEDRLDEPARRRRAARPSRGRRGGSGRRSRRRR